MKGINQRSLKEALHHVAVEFAEQPIATIEAIESKLAFCRKDIDSYFHNFTFKDDCHKLPLGAFRKFSFDELNKIYYSSSTQMDGSVTKVFEQKPAYEVVRKIRSSMWRWGFTRGTWNEVVDVWNGLRLFSLGCGPDFEIRLDYTTGYNQYGYSKYSRTFIDGVFAFLVYYKHEHVMTIAFSIAKGKQLLIQQVQLKHKTGNRWLYKFPKNRLEFVIDRFAQYFPHFTLCVIDGKSLAMKTIADYERSLRFAQERIARRQKYREGDYIPSEAERQEDQREVELFKDRIAHLKGELPRLADFYKNCGRHVLKGKVTINDIAHYQLELR